MVQGVAGARYRCRGLKSVTAAAGGPLTSSSRLVFFRIAGFGFAGALQAISIAAPWSGQPLWWLQLISLAALIWQLDGFRDTVRPGRCLRGALYGWLFASAWLCGTFWWLFISLHVYGGLAAPLAVLAVLGLAVFLSLYYATACAAFVAWAPRSPVGASVFFAALWTLGELLRGSWFTGFPWGAGGYAHLDGPLVAYAPWLGVYGIGAVAAALAAVVVLTLRSSTAPAVRMRKLAGPVFLIAVLLAGPLVLGPTRAGADTPSDSRGILEVELLQGNIPQDEKFVLGSGIDTALEWYGVQLRDAQASLVITPETALPLLPSQLPPGYVEAIAARYAHGTQAAIVGIPLEGSGGQPGGSTTEYGDYRNAVLGFKPDSVEPYRYEKHHLVPFGEFVPRMFRWFTNMMNIPLGDFYRGGLAQAPFVWEGQRIATNICYEDLFGDEIGANFRDAAQAPTILLNVSNIAWFGDSVAIDQHLAISRMRALEFERPMVRATNTGATAVIDHRGRVTHALPRLTRGVLKAEVEGRSGFTPFAWWVSRFGLWPLWGASLLTIAITLWGRYRSLAR